MYAISFKRTPTNLFLFVLIEWFQFKVVVLVCELHVLRPVSACLLACLIYVNMYLLYKRNEFLFFCAVLLFRCSLS